MALLESITKHTHTTITQWLSHGFGSTQVLAQAENASTWTRGGTSDIYGFALRPVPSLALFFLSLPLAWKGYYKWKESPCKFSRPNPCSSNRWILVLSVESIILPKLICVPCWLYGTDTNYKVFWKPFYMRSWSYSKLLYCSCSEMTLLKSSVARWQSSCPFLMERGRRYSS